MTEIHSAAKKQYKTRSKKTQKDQHQSRPQLDSITKRPQSLQKLLPKISLVKFIRTSYHLYKSCKRNSTQDHSRFIFSTKKAIYKSNTYNTSYLGLQMLAQLLGSFSILSYKISFIHNTYALPPYAP